MPIYMYQGITYKTRSLLCEVRREHCIELIQRGLNYTQAVGVAIREQAGLPKKPDLTVFDVEGINILCSSDIVMLHDKAVSTEYFKAHSNLLSSVFRAANSACLSIISFSEDLENISWLGFSICLQDIPRFLFLLGFSVSVGL